MTWGYTGCTVSVDGKDQVGVEQPGSPEAAPSARRGGRIPIPRLRRPEAPAPPGLAALLKKVRSYNPKADAKELERAFRFAETHHAGQKRLSGEPFIEHPLAVASIM